MAMPVIYPNGARVYTMSAVSPGYIDLLLARASAPVVSDSRYLAFLGATDNLIAAFVVQNIITALPL